MRSRSRSFAVLVVVAVVASARSTARATQEFKPYLYAPLGDAFGKGLRGGALGDHERESRG